MRFLFVRPEFCPSGDLSTPKIRLSSDSASRRTPLPLAKSSRYRATSGLSPYRTCAHRAHSITKAPCGCTVLLFQFDFTTDSMSSILISMVSQSCSLLPTSAINTLPPNASTIVASRPSFNRTVSYCFTSNYRTSEIYAVVILIFPSLAIHPTTTFAGFPVLPYSIIFCSYRMPYPLYPLFTAG